MSNQRTKKEKRPSGLGYLLLSVLAIAIGLCFFAFGKEMLETLAILIGAIVTLAGVIFTVITLTHNERGFRFGIKIAVYACVIAAGICTIILRKPAIEVLTNVFALLIVIDGAFTLNTAVLLHRERSRTYVILILVAIASIACGFLAITYIPHHYMLGAGMLTTAVANFISMFYVPSLLKKLWPEKETKASAEKSETAKKETEATEGTAEAKDEKTAGENTENNAQA
jgi:uncharacterized membrane protein HdeD (DUF308 family)